MTGTATEAGDPLATAPAIEAKVLEQILRYVRRAEAPAAVLLDPRSPRTSSTGRPCSTADRRP